jgi:hypothetical protein
MYELLFQFLRMLGSMGRGSFKWHRRVLCKRGRKAWCTGVHILYLRVPRGACAQFTVLIGGIVCEARREAGEGVYRRFNRLFRAHAI